MFYRNDVRWYSVFAVPTTRPLQQTTITMIIIPAYIDNNIILLHKTISPDERRSRCAEDLLGESVFYTEPKNRRTDVYNIIRKHNDIIMRRYRFLLGFHLFRAKYFFSSFTGPQPFFSAVTVVAFPPRIRWLSAAADGRLVARNIMPNTTYIIIIMLL